LVRVIGPSIFSEEALGKIFNFINCHVFQDERPKPVSDSTGRKDYDLFFREQILFYSIFVMQFYFQENTQFKRFKIQIFLKHAIFNGKKIQEK